MTAADVDATLSVMLFDEIAEQQIARAHELMCRLMREHATAEGRTWARLEVLRLEKAMAR